METIHVCRHTHTHTHTKAYFASLCCQSFVKWFWWANKSLLLLLLLSLSLSLSFFHKTCIVLFHFTPLCLTNYYPTEVKFHQTINNILEAKYCWSATTTSTTRLCKSTCRNRIKPDVLLYNNALWRRQQVFSLQLARLTIKRF